MSAKSTRGVSAEPLWRTQLEIPKEIDDQRLNAVERAASLRLSFWEW